MSDSEKLKMLKVLLNPDGTETIPPDETLAAYLQMAQAELLNYLYTGSVPAEVTAVPKRYEMTQLMAVVTGISLSGNEAQTAGSENGISRTWKYSDMVEYIRRNVIPYGRVVTL